MQSVSYHPHVPSRPRCNAFAAYTSSQGFKASGKEETLSALHGMRYNLELAIRAMVTLFQLHGGMLLTQQKILELRDKDIKDWEKCSTEYKTK